MVSTQKPSCLFTSILKQKIIILSVLTFLPIYIFYLTIFVFAVNIPYWDDYDAILGFINNYLESNFKNKVTLILSQHNEHRIVFTRVITLLTYYLTNKINFKLLTFIGNISLIGLLLVLLKSFMFSKNKFLYFLPAIFLLFQPQYWGTIYFAMASLSNLYVLFFVFLSLYLLTKQSIKCFLFSLLSSIFATFTSGNGMLVFFVGLVPLIYQKRYKEIILWMLVGIGCVSFYFYGYIKPSQHPGIVASIFATPAHTIIYYFSYLGLCLLDFSWKAAYLIPLFLGILFFLHFIYLIKTKYYKKNIVITSFLLFLFLTGAVVSLSRSGFEQGLPSRYKIVSVLFLILFYFSIMEIMPHKIINRIFPILLVFSFFFNLFSYHKNFDYIILQKKYLIEGLTLWRNKSSGLSYPDKSRANLIMLNAISKKYYLPPEVFLSDSVDK